MHIMVIGTNSERPEYQGFNSIQLKKKRSKTKKLIPCPEKFSFLNTEVIILLLKRETLTSKNDKEFEDSVSTVKLMLTCLLLI